MGEASALSDRLRIGTEEVMVMEPRKLSGTAKKSTAFRLLAPCASGASSRTLLGSRGFPPVSFAVKVIVAVSVDDGLA